MSSHCGVSILGEHDALIPELINIVTITDTDIRVMLFLYSLIKYDVITSPNDRNRNIYLFYGDICELLSFFYLCIKLYVAIHIEKAALQITPG